MRDFIFGRRQDNGRALSIPARTWGQSHSLIFGGPGSGKSKLLELMARHHLAGGEGGLLVDPHGGVARDLINWSAFHARRRKLVVVNPSDDQGPVLGISPFRQHEGVAFDVQVDVMLRGLLSTFGEVDVLRRPTLGRVLRLLFSASILSEMPLHECARLINWEQRDFREDIIGSLGHESIRRDWQDIQSLKTRGAWRDEVLSTQNRLHSLVHSPTTRRFLGCVDQRRNLDFLGAMESGQFVVLNLQPSGTLSSENARALGALGLSQAFLIAVSQRRASPAGKPPRPWRILVDEWQTMCSPDIEYILAEGRKFGIPITLATQTPSQVAAKFSEEFLNAIFGLARLKVVFGGLGHVDAMRMCGETLPGLIDYDQEKHVLWSTKFRPYSARAKSYTTTTSSSHTESSGTSHGSGFSSGSSRGSASCESADPDEWSYTESIGASENATYSSGLTSSSGETHGSSKSVSDVPVTLHEQFEEVSSRTTYSLEEQRYRWAEQLMELPPRKALVKLPGARAALVEIPFVRDPWVSRATSRRFLAAVHAQAGALPPEEVDRLLARQSEALQARLRPTVVRSGNPDDVWQSVS